MAKKARRKHLSDKTATLKKSNKITKTSKFEFNFNKEKYKVLGRRKQKGETGRPSVSRGNAIEERKKTLGNEIRNFGKSNKFVDRRLGERDTSASKEEKMIKRFAAERRKRYGGTNIYQLDDVEENLTHYGQSLSEIEKFVDKPMSDEDEPNLNAEANFGGDSAEDDQQSRKNFIDDMIVKSKQLKHEKQAQKEQIQDMTDKLDEQWKNILNEKLMHQLLMSSSDREVPAEKTDYDVLVKELLFEKQQFKATDRLKSEEELAKEERDKLEKMEQQRLRRMALEGGDDQLADKYCNPDDLETNLVFDRRGNRFDRKAISYDADGKIVQPNEISDGESTDDDEEDDQLDLNLDDDDEEEKEVEKIAQSSKTESNVVASSETQNELPFVYEMPKSYSQLHSLLFGRDVDDQWTVLNRLMKCLHPSLKEGNKQKLQKLFLFVLRYFDDVCESSPPNDFSALLLLDKLTSALFKLASYGADYAAKSAKALLKKHRNDFSTKFKRKRFPNLNVFAFLRLVTQLFPSSDSWHPVVTPSLLFASELLTKCKIKTSVDIGKGLLLCSIVAEYVSESKRYVPEVVAFLNSVYFSAIDVERHERPSLSTFGVGKPSKILLSSPDGDGTEQKTNSIVPLSLTALFSENAAKVTFNASSCLFCATKLSRALFSLWLDLPSVVDIFEPIRKFTDRLSTSSDSYPDSLRKELNVFRTFFDSKRASSRRSFLKFPIKPGKEFILYEPRIETNFNPERKIRKATKGHSLEQQRLQHKYKREYKSTVRELKRDNEFLARQKFHDRVQVDKERTEKTKRLMSSLMGQEADYQKLKRMKKD